MNLPPTTVAPALRLWPGVLLIALQWFARFVIPAVFPDATLFGVLAGPAGAVAVFIWWLFFSRARWSDRLGVLIVMAVALAATARLVHPSIAGGMMGMMLPFYALPGLSLALVASAAVTRNFTAGPRRVVTVAALLLACAVWTLVRTGGFSSDFNHDWAWRWTPTPEDRLVTQNAPAPRPTAPTALPAAAAPAWPAFRGPNRDSILRGGPQIATNWASTPPTELWRHPVGPGWSSFAVSGDMFYTQEQRGDEELVSCYRLATGEPVWRHHDATRFWESNAGPGPRGTPTLHAGRVYTFGATGVLNALDASTGAVVWTRNAATDTKSKTPDWGFASSPLIVGDLVVVAVSGTLAAYDIVTGGPRWTGPADGGSYSSPHLLEIDGVPQIALMNGPGLLSVSPADGKVLWQHAWKGFAIVQPAQIAPGQLLISTGDRTGARRLSVTRKDGIWTVDEQWTTNKLKAYFNDFVVHGAHAYGFDGGMLTCIDLADGSRKWKGGRYGAGQLVLLADQNVLLVLSEQGDLALVSAVPADFTELARLKALEGKTWNHPVVAGTTLLIRNDREMAAYRLR